MRLILFPNVTRLTIAGFALVVITTSLIKLFLNPNLLSLVLHFFDMSQLQCRIDFLVMFDHLRSNLIG